MTAIHDLLTTLPKVSVVIPVYNTEKYLAKCLDSVLGQSIQDLEILCIDDGSTDNSVIILQRYARMDPRIRVICQENQGQGMARNVGMAEATGKYISFIDSGDYIEPQMYEKLLIAADTTKSDVVECGAFVENEGGASDEYVEEQARSLEFPEWSMDIFSEELFENKFHACVWVKLYNLDFLRQSKVTFDGSLKKGEDAVFQWCIMPHCKRYRRIPDKLYHYVVGRIGSTETVRNPRSDWCNHVCGCRVIFEHWKQNNFLSKSGFILLRRLWTLSKWRYNLCYGGGSCKKFIDNMVEIMSLFDRSFIYKNLEKFSKKDQKLMINILAMIKPKVILSLTSYPARIRTVHRTIQTLLQQSYCPDRVILWLADSQFPRGMYDLPKELISLRNQGLEIQWTKDLRSYKKLIPALKLYPQDIIVTVDDDILYPNDWLDNLVKAYEKNPTCIHAGRVHGIEFLNPQKLAPYDKWCMEIANGTSSYRNFFTGCGGCLYPPNSLHRDVLNEEVFMKLCPNGDDIWFWAMAVLSGTKVCSPTNRMKLEYVEGTQKCALWINNINNGENDFALARVIGAYPEVLSKLQTEVKLSRVKYAICKELKICGLTLYKCVWTVNIKALSIVGVQVFKKDPQKAKVLGVTIHRWK